MMDNKNLKLLNHVTMKDNHKQINLLNHVTLMKFHLMRRHLIFLYLNLIQKEIEVKLLIQQDKIDLVVNNLMQQQWIIKIEGGTQAQQLMQYYQIINNPLLYYQRQLDNIQVPSMLHYLLHYLLHNQCQINLLQLVNLQLRNNNISLHHFNQQPLKTKIEIVIFLMNKSMFNHKPNHNGPQFQHHTMVMRFYN